MILGGLDESLDAENLSSQESCSVSKSSMRTGAGSDSQICCGHALNRIVRSHLYKTLEPCCFWSLAFLILGIVGVSVICLLGLIAGGMIHAIRVCAFPHSQRDSFDGVDFAGGLFSVLIIIAAVQSLSPGIRKSAIPSKV